MAKTKSDQRRKRRSSSPRDEAPSSWSLPLFLSACFILSILIVSSSEDSLTQHDDVLSSQQGQRRFLLNNEDQVLDVGLEENVWHRQLRARKGSKQGIEENVWDRNLRNRKARELRQQRNNDKSTAAAAIDWGDTVVENVWHAQLRAQERIDNESAAARAAAAMEGGDNVMEDGGGSQLERRLQRNNDKSAVRSMAAEIEGGENVMEDGGGRRMAVIPTPGPRYTDKHHFEECIGKSIEECQTLIDTFVTANPDQFNNQTTLMLDIRKIRELTDDSYFKVVLRTNLDADKVDGILDDGMVYYPWPWQVEGEDTTIGPWECQGLEPAECCQLIQGDVTSADDNGNFLACFVEEPVGSLRNPEREDRAITIINAKGKVLRAPVAH